MGANPMAAVSYWFLSPSFLLALWGKWKGWDPTEPTPAVDWRQTTVDAVVPARNEESTIGLALSSLIRQDFPIRQITVFDDHSTDHTAQVVRQFAERSSIPILLVEREAPGGKTRSLRESAQASDADVIFNLDADTVLTEPGYVSACVEELFKNASTSAVCGEVTPWSRKRRQQLTEADPRIQEIYRQLAIEPPAEKRGEALLEAGTVIYRKALYMFLQRIVYDGHLKLCGSQLNPVGCAVAYRRERLVECFSYANPKMGDNLSNSEDIFIGHFFTWKGYRNMQIKSVKCESREPSLRRLPHQLYLWSSAFLQALYYFQELPLSPYRRMRARIEAVLQRGAAQPTPKSHELRRIREQYRAPWGEQYTRRFGRTVGFVDLAALVEHFSYPLVMLYLALFNREAFLITLSLEITFSTIGVFTVADRGSRCRSAGLMLAATPVRLLSLGVDLYVNAHYLFDLATGNRRWRK
jgi:glycosyltransferase involved in cell wall biosynthesis